MNKIKQKEKKWVIFTKIIKKIPRKNKNKKYLKD